MNQSSLFGPSVDHVWGGRKRKGRKPRTGLTAGSNLPPAISQALGDAELYYINGNNEKAIELLSEVARKAPKLPEPYSILALIYESSGDTLKALQLYALTASYTPKAGSLHLWEKVAELASELGELDQAILALKRCINLGSCAEFYQDKIRIFLRQKNLTNAKSTLNKLLCRFKNQEHFLVEYGNQALAIGYKDLAVDSFTRYIFHLLGTMQVRAELFPTTVMKSNQPAKPHAHVMENVDFLYQALYKAVDALMDKPDGLMPAMELIELCGEWTLAVKASLPPDDTTGIPELPMLVVVMYAVCKLRLEQEGQTEEALGILKNILQLVDQGELLPHLKAPANQNSGYFDADNDYSLDHLSTDLDLLRQLMRTAIELVAVGMVTRSQKLISFIEESLKAIAGKPLVQSDCVDRTSYSPSAITLRAKVDKEIPSLWCQLAGTYESLELPDKALRCYLASLNMCAHHPVSLQKYARLARSDFPGEVKRASQLLQEHFTLLVSEFQTLRQHHGGEAGGAGAEVAPKRTRRKRALDQDSHAASFDKLRRTVDTATASGGSSRARSAEHASLPVHDDNNDGSEDEGEDITYDQSEFVEDNDNAEAEQSDGDNYNEGEGEMDELDSDLGGDDQDQDEDGGEEDAGNNERCNDLDDDAAEEDQQQLAQWHWRAANKSIQFTQDDLKHEILALSEWSKLLKDDKLHKAFVSIIVPLLDTWAVPGGQGKTTAAENGNEDSSVAAAALQPTTTFVPKLGRKLRNKDAQTVSMYQLATSTSTRANEAAADPNPVLAVLDTAQVTCFEFVASLAKVVSVEQILSKDALVTLATEIKTILEGLELSKYGAELLHRCNMKSIEKFTYHSGRQRTSKVRYVEYSTIDNPSDPAYETSRLDDPSAAAVGPSGRNLHLTTDTSNKPAIIAWNKIRRPVEDPLITAAHKISATAGTLARKLTEQPDDIACANDFYRNVLHNLDCYAPNGTIELQLPLSRLVGRAPRSVVAQLFAGHDLAVQRKHALALEKYFGAFCVDPEQPLTALCIGSYLMMLTHHKLTKQRHEVLLKGIAFMHRYLALRRNSMQGNLVRLADAAVAKTPATAAPSTVQPASSSSVGPSAPVALDEQSIYELALYQETLYNLGRAFHEMRLFHLATDQYQQALALAEKYPQLAQNTAFVTTQAAHNLVQVYKHSGATNLAFEVMQQFLVL